jgi:hypothetical protein
MSCAITIETIDSQPTEVRNFVGDVAINLTSTGNGGAGYVPPPCDPLGTPQPAGYAGVAPLPAVHSTVVSAPEPGTVALLALGLAALRMSRGRSRHSKPT